jgi:translation initiation factor 2B subunit (eIF-2B alpha/beta/delta family)
VHPIERLRYVARASGADQALLVRETSSALAAFRGDPAGLVTACRRIVARQPASGPLWWLCARALTAGDPMVEAWQAADEIEADPTPRELAHALADEVTVVVLGWPETVGEALARRGDVEVLVVDTLNEGSGLVRRLLQGDADAVDVPLAGLGAAAADADLLILEASAVGPDAFVSVAGARAAAAVARHAGVPVWLTAGVGRLLPARMWEALVAHLPTDDPWDADDEVVPLDLVTHIVGPTGPQPVDEALRRTDCPVAAELFKLL